MIYDIVTYPSEILTTPTSEVPVVEIESEEIQRLIQDMIETCIANSGRGLAANQIGVSKSIFVYRDPKEKEFGAVINPKLISKRDLGHSKNEGCLSLPNMRFNVKRYKKVTIEGYNTAAEKVVLTTKSKMLAWIFQHEIDHLAGITLKDKGKLL